MIDMSAPVQNDQLIALREATSDIGIRITIDRILRSGCMGPECHDRLKRAAEVINATP